MENDETTRQNVQAFLQRLSTIPHATSIDPAEATKLAFLFLRARKFDVNRAIELYKAYRHMRYSQQLEHIDPLDEGVRRELLSEKFTVLPHSDPSEPTVFVFSVRRHWPPNSTDRDVLKGILYQLDAALLEWVFVLSLCPLPLPPPSPPKKRTALLHQIATEVERGCCAR
nr:unnamed protein product [Spirometra erinaceieuropaei]